MQTLLHPHIAAAETALTHTHIHSTPPAATGTPATSKTSASLVLLLLIPLEAKSVQGIALQHACVNPNLGLHMVHILMRNQVDAEASAVAC